MSQETPYASEEQTLIDNEVWYDENSNKLYTITILRFLIGNCVVKTAIEVKTDDEWYADMRVGAFDLRGELNISYIGEL